MELCRCGPQLQGLGPIVRRGCQTFQPSAAPAWAYWVTGHHQWPCIRARGPPRAPASGRLGLQLLLTTREAGPAWEGARRSGGWGLPPELSPSRGPGPRPPVPRVVVPPACGHSCPLLGDLGPSFLQTGPRLPGGPATVCSCARPSAGAGLHLPRGPAGAFRRPAGPAPSPSRLLQRRPRPHLAAWGPCPACAGRVPAGRGGRRAGRRPSSTATPGAPGQPRAGPQLRRRGHLLPARSWCPALAETARGCQGSIVGFPAPPASGWGDEGRSAGTSNPLCLPRLCPGAGEAPEEGTGDTGGGGGAWVGWRAVATAPGSLVRTGAPGPQRAPGDPCSLEPQSPTWLLYSHPVGRRARPTWASA